MHTGELRGVFKGNLDVYRIMYGICKSSIGLTGISGIFNRVNQGC